MLSALPSDFCFYPALGSLWDASEPWQHDNAAPALQGQAVIWIWRNSDSISLKWKLYHTRFPATVVMSLKTLAIKGSSIKWRALCVEHSGGTKARSACAGLWRPSFCVHYLLFMYIPLLWFVARATLCTKRFGSHVHREGKHIFTAVDKTVCVRTCSCNTHTQTSHKNVHLPLPLLASFSHDSISQIQGQRISPPLNVSYFQFFFFFSYFLPSLMSDQGHLILSNPYESDSVYWLLHSCQAWKRLLSGFSHDRFLLLWGRNKWVE